MGLKSFSIQMCKTIICENTTEILNSKDDFPKFGHLLTIIVLKLIKEWWSIDIIRAPSPLNISNLSYTETS